MGVAPQEAGAPESEVSVTDSLRIEGDHEGKPKAILKRSDSVFGLERDDDNRGVRLLEAVLLLGHLHEMTFAQQSPDVAQKRNDHGHAAESGETQLLSTETGQSKIRSPITRFHQSPTIPARLTVRSVHA